MNFLRGCASTILCILIFLFTAVAFTILALQSTILSPKFISEIIDELNLKEIASSAIDQITIPETEDENSLDKEVYKDLANSISEEDSVAVKDVAKNIVNEFFSYLNGETNTFEYELKIEDFAGVIANVISSSSETIEKMDLPFDVCTRSNEPCITKDQLQILLEKAIQGSLTADDIEMAYPKCPAGYTPKQTDDLPECLTDAFSEEAKSEINAFLYENNVTTDIPEQTQDGFKTSLQISSANFPKEIKDVRAVYISIVKPLPYILLGVSALFALLLILILNTKGFLWVGILFTLEGLLMILGKLTSSMATLTITDELSTKISDIPTGLLEIITGLLSKLVNTYNNAIAIYGIVLLVIGVVSIIVSKVFGRRKEDILKNEMPVPSVQPVTNIAVTK